MEEQILDAKDSEVKTKEVMLYHMDVCVGMNLREDAGIDMDALHTYIVENLEALQEAMVPTEKTIREMLNVQAPEGEPQIEFDDFIVCDLADGKYQVFQKKIEVLENPIQVTVDTKE